MKIHYIWEESDVVAGLRVYNTVYEKHYLVCAEVGSNHTRFCLVDVEDGVAHSSASKKDIADIMTAELYEPENIYG